MKSRISAFAAIGLMVASLEAQAALTTYADDLAGFLAATGATSIGALPSGVGTGTVVGPITFTNGPSASIAFNNYSNEIAGNDLGVSGVENINLAIAGGAYSLGFNLHEPAYFGVNSGSDGTWGCNATCVNSIFRITLFDGATQVDTFTYDAPNDPTYTTVGVVGFIGMYSTVMFNRVEIRDTSNNIDNEIFGNFLLGQTQPDGTSVPEPGTLALLGLGLAGLGVSRRRKAN